MSTAEHATCESTHHHQLQSSGTEPHTVLMKDLLAIVDCMKLGTAAVNFVPKSNGNNVWAIQGPKKNPLVMLHYQNDSSFVGKEGAEEVTAIADSNNDERNLNCTTWTSVLNSSVLNNCETEQRELPSNFEVKSEATCQDILHSMSGQRTSKVKSIAARGDRPTVGLPDFSGLKSVMAYAKQEVFFNATDEHFAVCEISEDVSNPCRQMLEQNNGPFCEFVNKSETYNNILARTSPIVEDACIIKSEPTDNVITYIDLILQNDTDSQVTSTSWISENKNICSMGQSIAEICSETFMNDNELERNITDVSIEIAIKDCSVVVEPLDASTMKNLETIGAENRVQQLDAKTSADAVNAIGQNDHQCQICSKVFQHLAILKFHEKRQDCQKVKQDHEQSSTQECSSSCKKKCTRRHQETQQQRGEMDIKCCNCAATFECFEDLKKHEKLHTGEGCYQCSFCYEKFKTDGHRKRHEQAHRSTAERPYHCSYCDNKFTQSGAKTTHERIHTGEKPYHCSYCDKQFSDSSSKRAHERIHTGEKPYQCSYCDKKFSHSGKKITHERTHTGEKPYECSHCDKKFMRSSHKTEHERTHTDEKPYRCSYCDKTFAQSANWKRHERSHTGEQPYHCSFCDKKFSDYGTKSAHERIHTGEKPYHCSYCDKKFKRSGHKTSHERTHNRQKNTFKLLDLA